MLSSRIRVSFLPALLLVAAHSFAQCPPTHGAATRCLQIGGDLVLVDGGSVVFLDKTVQSTAGIVGVSAGTGVTVTGTSAVTVAVNPAQVQTRVASTCPGGIAMIHQDGSVACT